MQSVAGVVSTDGILNCIISFGYMWEICRYSGSVGRAWGRFAVKNSRMGNLENEEEFGVCPIVEVDNYILVPVSAHYPRA